jgi:hypothetical protein
MNQDPPRPIACQSVALLLWFLCLFAALSVAQSPILSIELGERIYREGVLPSGRPIRATVQGDVAVEGTQFNCASCHRRSGFGSSEGAAFVPPVTGRSLYQSKEPRRVDLFRRLYQEVHPKPALARIHDSRTRPAYTDETLAIAIREGKDPTGRELDPLMPRYRMSDEDMGHLIAYLKSLSSTPVPGVTESAIHFATIVAEGVDSEKRKAMLDVMHAYFRWKNADTKRLLQRPGSSPYYLDDFYSALREWVLHVWELRGPKETWPAQLDESYRSQPVFALLGGIGVGEWQPIHEFCERTEAPCLFPHTDLPIASPTGAYSVYFSKGPIGEAEALARYLHDKPGNPTRIVQVYRNIGSNLIPSRAFRRALQSQVQDQMIESAQELTPAFWKNLLKDTQPSVLVLWLGAADVETLALAPEATTGIEQVYLSYSLLEGTLPSLPDGLRDKVHLTYPLALPQHESPDVYRIRAWLRSRGVKRTQERLQLNTYFTLSLADYSLMHLVENFSRDYFIEIIEREAETSPNPGVYPNLSLGPGQRFASKGYYIVKLSDKAKGGLEAVSDWIIP